MSISITAVRKSQSLQADNQRMDVEINHPKYGWIPYTLDPSDPDMTVNNNDLLTLIGSNFTAYVAPTQAEFDAAAAEEARAQRDMLLATQVDPIVSNFLRWASMTSEKQAEWTQYRLNLLNVPQQADFPQTINWPIKP